MGMNWYILYAESKQCNIIAKQLSSYEGVQAFLPKTEKWFANAKVKEFRISILYSGVVFIKSEMTVDELKACCENDYSVEMIENSVKKVFERLFDDEWIVRKSTGDIINKRLIIYDGPLIGLEDRIIKINRHKRYAFLDFGMAGSDITKVPLEVINKS